MFDSIKMRAIVDIENDVLPWSTMYIDEETGSGSRYYVLDDSEIPYFRYSSTGKLIVQISIPKFLYGNNVTMTNEIDIELFWRKLHDHIYGKVGVSIDRTAWIMEKCDVCHNFVSGNDVSKYIRQLATRHVAYLKPVLYGYDETIEFRNSSSRMKFYDKHKQCIDADEPQHVIEKSQGILRFEVTPSKADMRKYSPERRANDLLTKDFFDYIMNQDRVKSLLRFDDISVEQIDFDWVLKRKITEVERLIGFMVLASQFDDSQLRELYTHETLRSRKQMLKQTRIPNAKQLADLVIGTTAG